MSPRTLGSSPREREDKPVGRRASGRELSDLYGDDRRSHIRGIYAMQGIDASMMQHALRSHQREIELGLAAL